MKEIYETEVHRRVFHNRQGWHIKVGPDADGLGLVEVDGRSDAGRIVITTEMACLVADAMRQCAEELAAA